MGNGQWAVGCGGGLVDPSDPSDPSDQSDQSDQLILQRGVKKKFLSVKESGHIRINISVQWFSFQV